MTVCCGHSSTLGRPWILQKFLVSYVCLNVRNSQKDPSLLKPRSQRLNAILPSRMQCQKLWVLHSFTVFPLLS